MTPQEMKLLVRGEIEDALWRIRPLDPEPLPWDRVAEREACAALLRGDRPPEWLTAAHFLDPLCRSIGVASIHLRDADWEVTTMGILKGMALTGVRVDAGTATDVCDLEENYAVLGWPELQERLTEKLRARRMIGTLLDITLKLRYGGKVEEAVARLRKLTAPAVKEKA